MHTKGRSLSSDRTLTFLSTLPLILRGLLVALGFSFLLLFVNVLLIYFTPFPEIFVPYLHFAGALLSILLGAVFVGKKTQEKGWLRGGLMGFCYVLILLCLSCFLRVGLQPGPGLLTKLFLGFSLGAIGGIMGINS